MLPKLVKKLIGSIGVWRIVNFVVYKVEILLPNCFEKSIW